MQNQYCFWKLLLILLYTPPQNLVTAFSNCPDLEHTQIAGSNTLDICDLMNLEAYCPISRLLQSTSA